MSDVVPFGDVIALVALVGLAAVYSNRLATWLPIPAPAIFLVAAAVAAQVFSRLEVPTERTVQRVVTVALALILFDGGLQLRWSRFRDTALPIVGVGVVGTFLTAAVVGVLAHLLLGLSWYLCLLLGTAVAPTDPAVVFSVLGNHEVQGRSGVLLEGESGANDPVGIALLASLIGAGTLSGHAVAHAAGVFAQQMSIGLAIGVGGGLLLRWSMRISLPSDGLYSLRTLAGALGLYGAAAAAHGSGFLAVFAAGIIVGDSGTPHKAQIERFHAALASLAEIVTFVLLGLTVDLHEVARANVWVPGLAIGLALALVIRPAVVGLCLLPTSLRRNERAFVALAGLKGAVPILLGTFLLSANVNHAARLYAIVVVVVTFSVVVQGGLIPTMARRLGIQMRRSSRTTAA
jgi:cell volume regulation protein A